MKFKQRSRRTHQEYEKDLIKYWRDNKLFEKSVNDRPKDNTYIFYDGPPFITGEPHYGTLLSSIVKDVIPRYQTMKGKRVERVWGWDCHGLPAEVFTEKKLGIEDRRDIGTKISLEEYINTCRDNMIQTGNSWENMVDRIGRWVDFKGAYKTMDKDYMESVWWAFKKLFEAGKIYEGEKVLMYCIRDATPISKAEVAMDNSYQDVTDPSVYAKFRLKGTKNDLLVWTTVPWTLLANTGLAVSESMTYCLVKVGKDNLILSKDSLDRALRDNSNKPLDYEVAREFKGSDLVGQSYEPIFKDYGPTAHKIHRADFVSAEEGTGIVSQAPAYGEEDYLLAKERGFPVVTIIDDSGVLQDSQWKDQKVWDVDKDIAKTFLEDGRVWRIQYYKHSYPHCHRCGTKLIYRAHPSWFMDINGQKELMLEKNNQIEWFPEHIKKGRFAKTIESAPDWNLSRDRFWATAMPVWKGKDKQGKEHIRVVGSYKELEELSGVKLDDYHRPWIDGVTFKIDGVEYKRIEQVLDCWFESGSMPFAMHHYPFENVEKFEFNFPGDFIAEYIGQVRAWFYYLHAISVGLFDSHAFNNVIVTGTISGSDGRKMSKSYNNYTDPEIIIDEYGGDSLRFLLVNSPLLSGEDYAIQDKDIRDIFRKLSMIWNIYDFFSLYAGVDKWDSGLNAGELPKDPMDNLTNVMDQWIVSKVHDLSEAVDKNLQANNLNGATKPILGFIEDASNWYVRLNRRRFWKSDNDKDKDDAYRTLHYILVNLSLIIAPFTPFLSEELFIKLTGGESVHLELWPEARTKNELLMQHMQLIRGVINEGLSQRAAAGLKVRQPLQKVTAIIADEVNEDLKSIIAEELNVKKVVLKTDKKTKSISVSMDLKLTKELKDEGLMREIIRNVQSARKNASLEVDDRIDLSLSSNVESITSILDNKQLLARILSETLAKTFNKHKVYDFNEQISIEGHNLDIGLSKSKT